MAMGVQIVPAQAPSIFTRGGSQSHDVAVCTSCGVLLARRPCGQDALHFNIFPRVALAVLFTLCGSIVVYATIDLTHSIVILIRRVLLRGSTAYPHALSGSRALGRSPRPLIFLASAGHQVCGNTVIFGTRPGGALLGQSERAWFGEFWSFASHCVG